MGKISNAISNKTQLKILYRNLKQEWQERTIHPLQIFRYDNKFYITAYCELRDDIRHFEIERIKLHKKQYRRNIAYICVIINLQKVVFIFNQKIIDWEQNEKKYLF